MLLYPLQTYLLKLVEKQKVQLLNPPKNINAERSGIWLSRLKIEVPETVEAIASANRTTYVQTEYAYNWKYDENKKQFELTEKSGEPKLYWQAHYILTKITSQIIKPVVYLSLIHI